MKIKRNNRAGVLMRAVSESLEQRRLLVAAYQVTTTGDFDIAYDGSGALHMAYYDPSTAQLKYQIRSTTGVWSTPSVIATPTAGASDISIAVDASNKPGVVWHDDSGGTLLYSKYGTSWSASSSIRSSSSQPSLAFDSSSLPIVSYHRQSSDNDLEVSRYNGTSWARTVVDSTTNSGGDSSLVRVPGTTDFAVAYQAEGGSNNDSIFYKRQFSGSWSSATTIGNESGDLRDASLVFDSSSNPAVAYSDLGSSTKVSKLRSSNSSGVWSTLLTVNKRSEQNNLSYANGSFYWVQQNDVAQQVTLWSGSGSTWASSGLTVDGAGFVQAASKYVSGSGVSVTYARRLQSDSAQVVIDDRSPTLTTAPSAAPTLVAASPTSVTVSWPAVTNASNYELDRTATDPNSGASYGNNFTVITTGSSGTTYTDSTIQQGVNYQYYLRGLNGGGASAFSGGSIVLGAPTGLAVTGVTKSSIAIAWNAVPGVSNYSIERSVGSGSFSTLTSVASNQTTFTDSNLTAGTRYRYRLRSTSSTTPAAANSAATGAVNQWTLVNAPANVSVNATSSSSATVSWTSISGGTSYDVFRYDPQTSTYAFIANVAGLSYVDNSLSAGQSYLYQVRGNTADTYSEMSDEAGAYITFAASIPDDVAQVDISPTEKGVSWTKDTDDVTAYIVERKTNNGVWQQIAIMTPQDSDYFDTTVSSANTYDYRVTAENGASASAHSDPTSHIIPPTKSEPNNPYYTSSAPIDGASGTTDGSTAFFNDGNDLPAGRYRISYAHGLVQELVQHLGEYAPGFVPGHSLVENIVKQATTGFSLTGGSDIALPGIPLRLQSYYMTNESGNYNIQTNPSSIEDESSGLSVIIDHPGGPLGIKYQGPATAGSSETEQERRYYSDSEVWTIERLSLDLDVVASGETIPLSEDEEQSPGAFVDSNTPATVIARGNVTGTRTLTWTDPDKVIVKDVSGNVVQSGVPITASVDTPFSVTATNQFGLDQSVDFTYTGTVGGTTSASDTIQLHRHAVTIKWKQVAESPLTANTGEFGGLSIFPDDLTPNDTVLHDKVEVDVRVWNAPATGTTVYLRSFDVDDPSSDLIIDPNDTDGPNQQAQGGDNRGTTGGTFVASATHDISISTDADGFGSAIFQVSMQPGDNFRIAAALAVSGLDKLYTSVIGGYRPSGGDYVYPGSGQPVFNPQVGLTDMLTVWRHLWIERDAMTGVTANTQTFNISGVSTVKQPGTGGSNDVLLVSSLDVDDDELEGGRITIPGVGTFPIYSNHSAFGLDDIKIPAGSIPAGTAFPIVGATAVDDDFIPPTGVMNLPSGGPLLDSSFGEAYIAPTYVDPTPGSLNRRGTVTFDRHLDGNFPVSSRDLPRSSGSYWSVYLVGAFEDSTDSDGDPDGISVPGLGVPRPAADSSISYGYTKNDWSVIFLETIDDFVRGRTAYTDEWHTVVHELGHSVDDTGNLFNNFNHRATGIMRESAPINETEFDSFFLNKFRSVSAWGA